MATVRAVQRFELECDYKDEVFPHPPVESGLESTYF
jgi:hypothetical protein